MCAAHLTVALVPQSKLKQSLLAAVSYGYIKAGKRKSRRPLAVQTSGLWAIQLWAMMRVCVCVCVLRAPDHGTLIELQTTTVVSNELEMATIHDGSWIIH